MVGGRPRSWPLSLDRLITLVRPDGTTYRVWSARRDRGGGTGVTTSSDAETPVQKVFVYLRQQSPFSDIGVDWTLLDERNKSWKIIAVREYRGRFFWQLQVEEFDG